MIRVAVDTSADITKEEIAAKNMILIPLGITVDEKESYRDEIDISRKELYKYMIEEGRRVKTSQPSPGELVDIFTEVKEAGDELICILLSSALSGTVQSAQLAKEMVGYDKIYIIDSLTATAKIRMLAERAQKMIEEGHTSEEIVAVLEEARGRIHIDAALNTLKYLYLGGRISKTTAVVADLASVKPGISVTMDGKVAVGSKYLGVGRAVKDLVKMVKNTDLDPTFPLYLLFSYDDTNMKKLQKALEEAGIKVDGMYEIGATLGVHIGPGAFGVVYAEK